MKNYHKSCKYKYKGRYGIPYDVVNRPNTSKKLFLKVVLNCGAHFLKTFDYVNPFFHLNQK